MLLSPTTRHYLKVARSFLLPPGGSRLKKADVAGGGGDSTFEEAFSNISHSYLRDKAPGLMPFEIGFQLVEKNEDNNRAVAIMGFKAGNEWIYVPVFFLNGELKGHEVMYLKNRNRFRPLKENWLNYVLNQRSVELGRSVDRNAYRKNMVQSDLQSFTNAPMGGGKYASHYAADLVPGIAALCHAAQTSPFEARKTPNLHDFLKAAGAETTQTFVRWLQQSPVLSRAYSRFYKASNLKDVLTYHETHKSLPVVKRAAAELHPLLQRPKVEKRADTNVLFVGPDDLDLTRLLTTAEKTAYLQDDLVVRDKRAEASVPFKVTAEENLSNPTTSGIYDVLIPGASFEKCVVLMEPWTSGGPQCSTIVIPVGKSDHVMADRGAVWIKESPSAESPLSEEDPLRKWLASKEDATSLPVPSGDSWDSPKYLLIAPNGQSSAPFRVESGQSESGDVKRYEVSFCACLDYSRPDTHPPVTKYPRNLRGFGSREEDGIMFSGLDGSSLSLLGRTLVVPKGFKLVKLTKDDPDSRRLRLGSSADLWVGIVDRVFDKESSIKILHRSGEVILDGPLGKEQLGKTAALRSLIVRHGLRKEAAEEVLNRAVGKEAFRILVKYAEGYPLQQMGPNAPAYNEPQPTGDPMGWMSGAPTYTTQQERLPVDMPSGAQPTPMNYQPDMPAMQLAQQAGQLGQKEVFDNAAIGGLLKTMNPDRMVDKPTSVMDDGLDQGCRLLLSFYWNNDAFADRFGKSDLPELEELLRSYVEISGDLVLFLKNKEIGESPDMSFVDISDSAK